MTASKGKEKKTGSMGSRGRRFIRVLLIFILLSVIAVGGGLFASITMFRKFAMSYREDTLRKAARLAASEVDPGKIDDWLENGADKEFYETREELQHIVDNTPFLQYLYVVQAHEDGFHIIFDLTTSDEELDDYMEVEPSELDIGHVYPYDKSFEEHIPALLAGERISIIETNDEYGWLLTAYEPIYNKDGECKGYIGTDISMLGVSAYTNAFTIWVLVISLIFLAGVGLVGFLVASYAHRADDLEANNEQKNRDQIILQEIIESYAQVVDAKDPYTNGHSSRVAEYAVKIAELAGKSDEECQKIYFTALLHDVGKVGIPDAIINKPGKLTKEEFNIIQQHPEKGNLILSQIDEFSYLSEGAHFHHERYDGKGYPNGLKGDEIPEIARIIACADAYDAMTSRRSYRDPIPQHIVREEFVKGIGTQFDPEFARNMLHLIDLDAEYAMKDLEENKELRDREQITVSYRRSTVSPGVLLGPTVTTLKFKVNSDNPGSINSPKPSLLLFDSLDGHIHEIDKDRKEMLDLEYGEIWLNGRYNVSGARKIESKITDGTQGKPGLYTVEAVRIKDHALVKIKGNGKDIEVIIALPDSSRFAYIALTGEHCIFSNIEISQSDDEMPEDFIPRIAEEISYINVPAGDVPNVQADGYRSSSTDGILLKDKLTISFHTMSLPTARLVWHCPFICLFNSGNGKTDGDNYRELTLLRLDGECWEGDPDCSVELDMKKTGDFKDWNDWKQYNLEGYDVTVDIIRKDNKIITSTTNGGISITATTVMSADIDPVYVALTGDQCAITNIRIVRGE